MNMSPLETEFLTSAIKLFKYYKKLGEGAIALEDALSLCRRRGGGRGRHGDGERCHQRSGAECVHCWGLARKRTAPRTRRK